MIAATSDVLARMLEALPASSDDVEQQSRSVLRLVFDRILLGNFKPGEPVVEDHATCPNCELATRSARTPYCSETCREVAGFVRQVRGGLADGSILDVERQIAFGQVVWHLLGGGRPLRVHLIPQAARLQVIAKAGGLCALCGEQAGTVDHIATGCNRTINLRAVCDGCNRTKPFGDPTVLNRADSLKLIQDLAARIGSAVPLRCCDDTQTWDWRQFLEGRKAAMSPP